jgi:hypothetical protein
MCIGGVGLRVLCTIHQLTNQKIVSILHISWTFTNGQTTTNCYIYCLFVCMCVFSTFIYLDC